MARELLDDPHIIQERVVATAIDRQARFAQVNRELARVADVLICLVRSDAVPQPGGSLDLVEQARKRGRPLLAIRLGVGSDGQPVFEREEWYGRELFKLPSLPNELGAVQTEFKEIPPVRPYCSALLEFAGEQASGRQALFKYSRSSSSAHTSGPHSTGPCSRLAAYERRPTVGHRALAFGNRPTRSSPFASPACGGSLGNHTARFRAGTFCPGHGQRSDLFESLVRAAHPRIIKPLVANSRHLASARFASSFAGHSNRSPRPVRPGTIARRSIGANSVLRHKEPLGHALVEGRESSLSVRLVFGIRGNPSETASALCQRERVPLDVVDGSS